MSEHQKSDWQEKAKAKREEIWERIPTQWLLPEQTIAKAKESRSMLETSLKTFLTKRHERSQIELPRPI
jgi:hypothetical protein